MGIDKFNKEFKIGTQAMYQSVLCISKFKKVEIASEAYEIPSGEIVVKLKGMAGCFSIEHIKPAT